MRDRYFLDTNILVYSFTGEFPEKQGRSIELVRSALTGSGAVSWQVVQEFANVALHKFETPMSRDDLRDYLEEVLLPLCRVWPEESLYSEALSVGLETGYRWYDSLVVVSALRSGSAVLYSDDLEHGRVIRGLRIFNPFR